MKINTLCLFFSHRLIHLCHGNRTPVSACKVAMRTPLSAVFSLYLPQQSLKKAINTNDAFFSAKHPSSFKPFYLVVLESYHH